MRRTNGVGVAALLAVCLAAAPIASAQMPDPSQMHGRSLPAPEAPVGSATVRIMRQTIGNNVPGQAVSLLDAAGTIVATRTTDEGGRASFDNLRPGTDYTAVADVAGEKLRSLPFTQPASGGVRVVLFAGLVASGGAAAPAPAAPARPAPAGSVVLGTQSRLVIEQADEFVEVFVLTDFVNTTDGPVALPTPLAFALPEGALGATVLEGTTAAVLEGGRVIVKGPLPAGPTPVQFGYRLPSDAGQVGISQAYPVSGPMSAVIVRKVGDTAITVAGERQRRETVLEGRAYTIISTAAIAAGTPLDIRVSGLPARPRWPLRVALGLAGAIVLAGLVFGRARADDDAAPIPPART